MTRINFATESYELSSLPASAKRLVNLFAEATPGDARSEVIIRSTPGLSPFKYIGTGPILAMDGILQGRVYLVSGTEFYRLGSDNALTPTDLGYVGSPVNGFVSIAVGTLSAVVCVPPNAYIVDHNSNTMSQINDPAFTGASSVAYIDGYFVFTSVNPDSRFFFSNLLNGTSFSALNFAFVDGRPNIITKVVSHRGDLWFMGESGLEAWYDAGTPNFPFARRPGSDIPYGCGAPQSVVICDNSIFFLSYAGIVFRINGYQVVRVSTSAVEQWIRENVDYKSLDAFSYTQEGHWFYSISFTGTSQRTYVYDSSTQRWHERSSGANGVGLWLGRASATRQNYVLIGSRVDGTIFLPDPTLGNDAGQQLTRIATMPPLWADTKRAFMSRLELEMQPGINSRDASVKLEVSDDGGQNYRVLPEGITSGTHGDTKHRVFWTRLGSFRQRVIRFTLDDVCALYGADVIVTQGET